MINYQRTASRIFISHYDRPRPLDWNDVFGNPDSIHVEIGFGQGEFLLRSLAADSSGVHVGIELDWGRTVKCFKKIVRQPIQQQENISRSLKIFHIDAWVFFERLVLQHTIDHIECLFPCPWPKDRHEKHRLFSHAFMRLINSRLKENGTIHFVTDDWRYADWVAEQSEQTGFVISQQASPAKFDTKFEKKWSAGGQKHFCEICFQKNNHIDIPLKKDTEMKSYYHQHFDPSKFTLPEDVQDGVAVISKEWLFDENQSKGMIRVVVSEEHLTQHMWIVIIKTCKGWGVLRSEGQQILPTPGTARALELVSNAVEQTTA